MRFSKGKTFRRAYNGRLCLQLMFVAADRGCAPEMARIAAEIEPDEVQLNTPLRPCGVEPLSAEEMHKIVAHFNRLEAVVISVYETIKREVAVIDAGEVIRRRGIGD